MKSVLSILLVLSFLLLNGCIARMAAAEEQVDQKLDAIEDTIENNIEHAVVPEQTPPAAADAALTPAEAEAIALEHAGFTAEQVRFRHTEYEIDDGIPEYEIEFTQDLWEYDYTIHAETGEILSYDRDDLD